MVDGGPRSSRAQEPIKGRKTAAAGRDGAAAASEGKEDEEAAGTATTEADCPDAAVQAAAAVTPGEGRNTGRPQ